MSTDIAQIKNKRKRKKTFLQNARKYAKKGKYGRGSQLDTDTYQYFVKTMEVYKEGFPSDEERILFANNVLEQTTNEEINCCCNQIGCRVIEMLLPFANDTALLRFIDIIGNDLRRLCSDPFASHVVESLLTECCKRSLIDSYENDVKNKCKDFTMKVSKFLLNNLEDYIWDTYGNHILRTVLRNLSNLSNNKETDSNANRNNKITSENKAMVTLPLEYIELVKDYGDRLIAWPQFKDFPYNELTSGFLQIMLKALKETQPKLLKRYLKKLLEESFATTQETEENSKSEKLPDVFSSKPAMMLLEASLQIAQSKLYTQLYCKCFVGNLCTLAKTRNTNFAVQKLLSSCNEKTEFLAMFDELADAFQDILLAGHSGVILSVAQACKKLSAKQGSFVQKMMSTLNCLEPPERQNQFVLCMARLLPFESTLNKPNENLQKEKLNLHGTLILQIMLEFNKPIKIVNSILSMEVEDLKNLFSNSMGCHIIDSYVKSPFVGEKSREKLIRKLQGSYQDLATTKYGSRAFEAIWNVTSFKLKLSIMEELLYKEGTWSNSEFGRIIANKVSLSLFKRNKEEWKNSQNKANQLKSLLNIVE